MPTLEEIKAKLDELEIEIKFIFAEQDRLAEQQLVVLQDKLLHSGLLQSVTWKVNGRSCLDAVGKVAPLFFEYIGDYHSSFYINADIILRRSDDDVYLSGDLEKLVDFAKQEHLRLDVTEVAGELKEAKKKVKILTDLLNKFS